MMPQPPSRTDARRQRKKTNTPSPSTLEPRPRLGGQKGEPMGALAAGRMPIFSEHHVYPTTPTTGKQTFLNTLPTRPNLCRNIALVPSCGWPCTLPILGPRNSAPRTALRHMTHKNVQQVTRENKILCAPVMGSDVSGAMGPKDLNRRARQRTPGRITECLDDTPSPRIPAQMIRKRLRSHGVVVLKPCSMYAIKPVPRQAGATAFAAGAMLRHQSSRKSRHKRLSSQSERMGRHNES